MEKYRITREKVNITELRKDLTQFCNVHFAQQDKRDGYIGIKERWKTKFKNLYTPTQTSISNHINKYQKFDKCDLYISKNSHTTFKVSKKNILAFLNIVIDIDCHGIRPENMEAAIERLYYFLVSDFYRDYNIPMPNTIVFTGRGINCWYSIESMAASLVNIYEDVSKHIATAYQDAFKSSPVLKGFCVDLSSSCKSAGIYRMPGTYNTEGKIYGSICHVHEDKLDALDFYNQEVSREIVEKPVYMGEDDPEKLARKRQAALEKLARLRMQRGEDFVGYRDLFCFVYFSTTFSGNVEDAVERTLQINRSFDRPLRESALMGYLSTAISKATAGEPYLFTNQKIIDYLSITKEESELIGICPAKIKKPKRPGLTKKVTEENIEYIAGLAMDQCNKSQIARAVGVSVATVSKYLKEQNLTTDKEKKTKAMKKAIRRNMRRENFMARFGVGKSTYYYYKKEFHKDVEKKRKEKEKRRKERERRKELLRLRAQCIMRNRKKESSPMIKAEDNSNAVVINKGADCLQEIPERVEKPPWEDSRDSFITFP